ncbi:valine--tRNA ligase [Candidatus Dependentiae bacterium]|nr:valine--tRNA ligase [Candidatus Dependentiae bacterium]
MDKKYEHLQAEAQAQELWHTQNTYSADNNPGPLYSIDTPPPTVSGALHIGHVFSYTQTDIIARYKRMNGFSVFYPFGFDDNGLPTERFVEKKHNVYAHGMARSEFINLCLQETAQVEKHFEALWQRLGFSIDWSLSYSTIDARTRKISQQSFIELYKKGFIYRKDEPALYCTTCRTTVAQAELEDAEKPSTFNDIVFMCDEEKLVIGTTRPELLPSCVALLYHPEDTRYQHLKNKTATVPLFNYQVPVLEDTDVDPAKGTGLVMCCTFGDKTDILWYKKFNLPYRQSIGLDGKWVESTGPLAGLRVAAAREKVLEVLEQTGLLLAKKPIKHNVNIHERCKREIEYLILKQWFLKVLAYKQEFLALAEEIKWYPTFMKSRYKNWVENISWDWCLSRQRFYGIPFPAWHCTNCNETLLADPKDLPIDPQETPYPGTCSNCPGENSIVPDTDVMDTWNTSSLTPYIVAGLYNKNSDNVFAQAEPFMPMSMRPQAHDIIRTWAFYTIVKSWMHNKLIPWYTIVISGHVLSTEKEKISKSQGNSPLAPETLLNTYPADALRYWTASGTLGHDMAFSESQISIGQKLLIKLWNAFRFAQPYLEGYTPDTNQVPTHLGPVNSWLLQNSSTCFTSYNHYFELNEFSLALAAVEKFFWNDFCDNYLEIIKDQLMNPANYTAQEVEATRWTLYTVGLRILQLYAPFVPHVTETLYGLIYKATVGTPSLHQTRFTRFQKLYVFEQSTTVMEAILTIISQVRRLKTEQQLSLKTELATLAIHVQDPVLAQALKGQEALLKAVTKAHEITYSSQAASSKLTALDELWHGEITIS